MANLLAKAQTTIRCDIGEVWDALINANTIKKYMFGTTVKTDWKEGSKITWRGEWKGKSYEDKGEILEVVPQSKLRYSHYSPLTGLEDIPQNYHIVTIHLYDNGDQTMISLTQDNNSTEESRDHSEKNWMMMLTSLKKLLEEGEQ
jgi:uncharacterized protein YndB with AHSA1/START domain